MMALSGGSRATTHAGQWSGGCVQVKAPGIENQAAYRVWMLSLPPGALVRQVLLLNVELIDLARAAGQPASGSSCLHVPNTGMTGTYYCAWCFTWVLGTTTKVLVTVWQLNHLLSPLPQLSPPQPSTPNIISASPVCFKFYLDMTENIHFVCVHKYVCVSLLSVPSILKIQLENYRWNSTLSVF